MARNPSIDRDELDAAQVAVHDALRDGPRGGVRGPFPALLQVPELARRVADLGEQIRFHSTLPQDVAEVAILVVAAEMQCEYEAYAHARLAATAGVAPETVRAVLACRDEPLPESAQQLAREYARSLLRHDRVDDGLHDAALELFGPRGTVELVATISYFRMVATVLNAYEVGLPEGGVSALEGGAGSQPPR